MKAAHSNRKADDADSDSDWDSLSGDPEPVSMNEPTPRFSQPVPPSTNSQTNTSTPVRKPIKTPSKPSTPNVELHKGSSTSNQTPNQLYGKTGITTFVDHSNHSIITGKDENENKKIDQPVDSNSNSVIYATVKKRKDKNSTTALELNELDFNPVKDTGQTNQAFTPVEEPPYMNFKDALPMNDVKELNKREQKKEGKVKGEYVRNKTPDQLDISSSRTLPDIHPWDESDQDDDPQEFLNSQLPINFENKESVDGQGHVIDVHTRNDDGCCVPYQKNRGNGYTYIFNHGKLQYLNVVPEWREPYMKSFGERTERWLTYFWQECFGAIGVVLDFGLIFLLELIKFILRKVLVRLLVGFIVVLGDHLLKPVLAAMFNSLLQPSLTFWWNVLVGLRNAIQPLLSITSEIIRQITSLLRGFRLFELIWKPLYPNAVNTSQVLANRQQIQDI